MTSRGGEEQERKRNERIRGRRIQRLKGRMGEKERENEVRMREKEKRIPPNEREQDKQRGSRSKK